MSGLTPRVARVATVLTLLPVAFLLAAAQVAGAEAADGVAAERLSFSVVGPVGIVAVILGLGGLAVGLVRRRRTMATRAATALLDTTPMPAVAEPARRREPAA